MLITSIDRFNYVWIYVLTVRDYYWALQVHHHHSHCQYIACYCCLLIERLIALDEIGSIFWASLIHYPLKYLRSFYQRLSLHLQDQRDCHHNFHRYLHFISSSIKYSLLFMEFSMHLMVSLAFYFDPTKFLIIQITPFLFYA